MINNVHDGTLDEEYFLMYSESWEPHKLFLCESCHTSPHIRRLIKKLNKLYGKKGGISDISDSGNTENTNDDVGVDNDDAGNDADNDDYVHNEQNPIDCSVECETHTEEYLIVSTDTWEDVDIFFCESLHTPAFACKLKELKKVIECRNNETHKTQTSETNLINNSESLDENNDHENELHSDATVSRNENVLSTQTMDVIDASTNRPFETKLISNTIINVMDDEATDKGHQNNGEKSFDTFSVEDTNNQNLSNNEQWLSETELLVNAVNDTPDLPAKNAEQNIENAYKCDTCGKNFTSKVNLEYHVRIHNDAKPKKCNICNESFASNTALKYHLTSHHSDAKPYKCTICRKDYATKGGLQYHVKTHSGEKPYQCDTCGKGFIHPSNLRSHSKVHIGEKPYKCETCGRNFIKLSDLWAHTCPEGTETIHKCDACGEVFENSVALEEHLKTHLSEKPFKCDVCGKCFTTKDTLLLHSTTHDESTVEKLFSCEICSSIQHFTHIDHLKHHSTTTHKNSKESYKCLICEKMFSNYQGVRLHSRMHQFWKKRGKKPPNFSCGLCSKRFSSDSLLQNHINEKHAKKNQNEKPLVKEIVFKCHICDQKFTRTDLHKHITDCHSEKHTEKPLNKEILFKCDICNEKVYVRDKELQKHMTECHSKKRTKKIVEYSSTVYFPINNRNLASGIVHGKEISNLVISEYKCKWCNEVYSSDNDLQKHVKECLSENIISSSGNDKHSEQYSQEFQPINSSENFVGRMTADVVRQDPAVHHPLKNTPVNNAIGYLPVSQAPHPSEPVSGAPHPSVSQTSHFDILNVDCATDTSSKKVTINSELPEQQIKQLHSNMHKNQDMLAPKPYKVRKIYDKGFSNDLSPIVNLTEHTENKLENLSAETFSNYMEMLHHSSTHKNLEIMAPTKNNETGVPTKNNKLVVPTKNEEHVASYHEIVKKMSQKNNSIMGPTPTKKVSKRKKREIVNNYFQDLLNEGHCKIVKPATQNKHLVTAQPSFICKVCEKEFVDDSNLIQHMLTEGHNKMDEGIPVKFHDCSVKSDKITHDSNNVEEYQDMVNIVSENAIIKCAHCEKSFSSYSHLQLHSSMHNIRTHSEDHHGKKKAKDVLLTCHFCNEKCTKEDFSAHILSHKATKTSRIVKNIDDKFNNSTHYACLICKKVFRNYNEFQKHATTHKKGETTYMYSCKICNITYQNESEIHKHLVDCHGGKICHLCHKSFNAEDYEKHIKSVEHIENEIFSSFKLFK